MQKSIEIEKISIGIQTEFTADNFYSAEASLSTKLNNLFVNANKLNKKNLGEDLQKLLHEYIAELRNLSKFFINVQLTFIISELRQASEITDILEEIYYNKGEHSSAATHILFNTAILIRDCYIQSLETNQDYSTQRNELHKLVSTYEKLNNLKKLSISQQLKKSLIQNNLNNPQLEQSRHVLLTNILNSSYELPSANKYDQGTQTSETIFNLETIEKITSNNDNLSLELELLSLNKKYLNNHPKSLKIKNKLNSEYLSLVDKAYQLLKNTQKNSLQEYLSLLDGALEVQKFYIINLKQIGFIDEPYRKALQRAGELFYRYYKAIKNSNLNNDTKEFIFSLMLSMQNQATNLSDKRLCGIIINATSSLEEEKFNATNAMFSLINYEALELIEPFPNFQKEENIEISKDLFKNVINNSTWLTEGQWLAMISKAAKYLHETLNTIFPDTSFQDNWTYAIDLNVNSEESLIEIEDHIKSIYNAQDALQNLREALNIFHSLKLEQIETRIKENQHLASDKFIAFYRLTLAFRKDAYAYLFEENNNEHYSAYENFLICSEYSSKFIALLTKSKQQYRKSLAKEEAPPEIINPENTKSSHAQITNKTSAPKKKNSEKQAKNLQKEAENNKIWDAINNKYNLQKLFDFEPKWNETRFQIKDLESKKYIYPFNLKALVLSSENYH